MTTNRLLKIFDALEVTPEAVPALRKVILAHLLHAAVNSAAAISCAKTLREAHEVQRRSGAKGTGQERASSLTSVAKTDLPPGLSDIPTSLFDRLGNIASIEKGLSQIQRTKSGKYPLVVTAEARGSSESYDFEGPAAIVPMVSSTGHGDASLKRLHYQEGKYAVGNILAVVRPICPDLIRARFIYEYLSAFKDELLVSRMVGTANVSLTVNKLKEVPVPMVSGPMLSRIDELMALCDELAARQQVLQNARARVTESAFHHLARAKDQTEFDRHFSFILQHSSFVLDDVPQLRQAILQLAVQGRLISQNPKDEPAETFVSKSKAEKLRITKELRLKELSAELPINDGDKAFELPQGWAWAKMADLCVKLGAGSTPLGGKQIYEKSGIRFLRSQNVWNDGLHLDDVAFIPRAIHRDMSGTWVQPGDILLNITGASIGRCAIVPNDFDEANVSQHVAIVRLADKALRQFLHLIIISQDFQKRIMDVQVGVSREGLSMTRLKEFVVAVPPLAEQKRIVARVEALLRQCEALEAQLRQTRTLGAHLLDSTLHHLLAA